jgi:hypothetical protein
MSAPWTQSTVASRRGARSCAARWDKACTSVKGPSRTGATTPATSAPQAGDCGQRFQGERPTAALLDRPTHHGHLFEMNGESCRFRRPVKQRKDSGLKPLCRSQKPPLHLGPGGSAFGAQVGPFYVLITSGELGRVVWHGPAVDDGAKMNPLAEEPLRGLRGVDGALSPLPAQVRRACAPAPERQWGRTRWRTASEYGRYASWRSLVMAPVTVREPIGSGLLVNTASTGGTPGPMVEVVDRLPRSPATVMALAMC